MSGGKTWECVICNVPIRPEDSGLCDAHKYDEQLPPWRPPNTYEQQQAEDDARQVRMVVAMERIAVALECLAGQRPEDTTP